MAVPITTVLALTLAFYNASYPLYVLHTFSLNCIGDNPFHFLSPIICHVRLDVENPFIAHSLGESDQFAPTKFRRERVGTVVLCEGFCMRRRTDGMEVVKERDLAQLTPTIAHDSIGACDILQLRQRIRCHRFYLSRQRIIHGISLAFTKIYNKNFPAGGSIWGAICTNIVIISKIWIRCLQEKKVKSCVQWYLSRSIQKLRGIANS